MTYDPLLTNPRDHIRLLVNDKSGDPATEREPDATYDAKIALYGGTVVNSAGWKRAAADMAETIAAQLDQEMVSFTATGDMSISKSSDQAKTLRARAVSLRAEADALDAAASRKSTLFSIGVVSSMAVDA